jgi:hypothetical protein
VIFVGCGGGPKRKIPLDPTVNPEKQPKTKCCPGASAIRPAAATKA